MKWEYEVYLMDFLDRKDIRDTFNNWGTDGWELVQIIPIGQTAPTTRIAAVFKKPVGRPYLPSK
jgi:hypothetical protein